MPVLTKMEQIPERIWVDFLRADLIPPEEIPLIVPLERSFFMLSIPDSGFVVTSHRVAIYRKKFLNGLTKHDEVLLKDLKHFSYTMAEKYCQFYFKFANEKEYWIKMALNKNEAELVETKLMELAPELQPDISLF